MIERLFYGLPMLAERWNCGVDDLMHMGINRQAKIYHELLGVGDRRGYSSRNESHRYLEYWLEVPIVSPPEIYLCPPHSLRMIASGLMFDFARYSGIPAAVNIAYFNPALKVDAESLCMLPAEVERLDREVFGRSRTTALPAPEAPAVFGGTASTTAGAVVAPAGGLSAPSGIESQEHRVRPFVHNRRTNTLGLEIEEAQALLAMSKRLDTRAVMTQLAKAAGKQGSCITEAGADFVRWCNAAGKVATLDLEALRKRLNRRSIGRQADE